MRTGHRSGEPSQFWKLFWYQLPVSSVPDSRPASQILNQSRALTSTPRQSCGAQAASHTVMGPTGCSQYQ